MGAEHWSECSRSTLIVLNIYALDMTKRGGGAESGHIVLASSRLDWLTGQSEWSPVVVKAVPRRLGAEGPPSLGHYTGQSDGVSQQNQAVTHQ